MRQVPVPLLAIMLATMEDIKGEVKEPPAPPPPPKPTASRNAQCPCNSGKKYKKCCRIKA